MLIRRCPKCGGNLGIVTVLGPAYTNGHPVVCNHCHSTISLPWARYLPAIIVSLAVTIILAWQFLEKIVVKDSGIDSDITAFLFDLLIFLFASAALANLLLYWLFPLRADTGDHRRNEQKRQHVTDKNDRP